MNSKLFSVKDPKWAGGNMMFKYWYVIEDRNEDMVMVNMTKFTNMEGVFFKMDTETCEKLTETVEEYENFIHGENKQGKANNTVSGKEYCEYSPAYSTFIKV